MKQSLSALLIAIFLASSAAYAQKVDSPPADPKSTPAYAMLILRKVEVQAKLDSLLEQYTSDWPRAKPLQFELDALKVEMKKMTEVAEPSVAKLTSAYGTLILRRVF